MVEKDVFHNSGSHIEIREDSGDIKFEVERLWGLVYRYLVNGKTNE